MTGVGLMVLSMSGFAVGALAAANLPDPRRKQALITLGAAFVLTWPLMLKPTVGFGYWTLNGTFALIEFLIILSLVVLVGWVGQISLGHIAFVGVGAFAAATMADRLGWPFWIVLPLGVLVSVPFSLIVGLPALRLRGFYLALTTLAFMYTVDKMVFKQTWLGSSTRRPVIGGLSFDGDTAFYYLCLVFVGVVTFGVFRLRDSRYGRSFRAIRESESTAASFGVNTTRYKLLAFVLSGAMASLGGVLTAYATRSVGQFQFLPFYSILYLAYGVLGGITFMSGAALSAFNYRVLPEIFRTPQGGVTQLWIYLGGMAILLTMAVDPMGVVNQYRRARRAFADARAVKRARAEGALTETEAALALARLADREAVETEAGLAGGVAPAVVREAETERDEVVASLKARGFSSRRRTR